MTIGTFARKAGISADTVRYYEREGLLSPVRGENNYRVYGPADLARLHIVNQARAVGFTLAEIREMVEKISSGRRGCDEYEASARRKLTELDEKIQELQQKRERLVQAMDFCATQEVRDSCKFLPA